MKKISKKNNWEIWTYILLIFPVFLCLLIYILQKPWAHRKGQRVSGVERIELTEETDYDTFFLQTGLGRQAVDKLLRDAEWEKIREVQEAFLKQEQICCTPIFGWFTRSDRIESVHSAPLVDLNPGDILVSFSTHSMGWRHGHAGLVIDEEEVLECTSLGKDSRIVKVKHWRKYSNYIVLRVKSATSKERKEVSEYAKHVLRDVPYNLFAGFFGEKAEDTTNPYFGLQCAYLVWYAWQKFGYDLDSDGGRLVTVRDIATSPFLEVVQIYGMTKDDIY